MTAPPGSILISPSKLRAAALFFCLAFVLALALKDVVPDPSNILPVADLALTPLGKSALVAEALMLLAGAALWLAIAVSPRLAARVASRETRSFRVPVSPVLVMILIFLVTLLAVRLSRFFPPDVLVGNLLMFLSLGVVVLILIWMLSRAGIRLGSVLALGSWKALRGGLATAVCAFVLLKPLMFAIQVFLLCLAERFKLPFDFQALIREIIAYPSGPKLTVLLLTIVLIPPLLEEVVFRTFLFGSLRLFVGTLGAAVLSAGLFASLHFAPWQFLHLFALGVFLALVYEKTQSLYAPLFLHMLVNAETVGLILLGRLS